MTKTPQQVIAEMDTQLVKLNESLDAFRKKAANPEVELSYLLNWHAKGVHHEAALRLIYGQVKDAMERSISGENRATVETLAQYALGEVLRKASVAVNDRDAQLEGWGHVYEFITRGY